MTEQPYQDDEPEGTEREPNFRRKLEAEAKAGREASAKLAEQEAATRVIQQELALRRAGIDPEHPRAKLLALAYPELVDVDQLKSEWDKTGTDSGVPAADQAALSRIAQAASGGAPSGGANVNFEAELDSIPILVDGQYNPNYVGEVLAKTAEQAIREGAEFNVVGSAPKFARGAGTNIPATAPLRGD